MLRLALLQVTQAGLGDTALFSVTSSCHNCREKGGGWRGPATSTCTKQEPLEEPGAPTGAPLLQGGGAQVAAASPPVATATVGSVSLGVPTSFTHYPFQAHLGSGWVEGRVVGREVLASCDHRWRVQLPAPRHEEVIWMDRAEFLKQLEMHKLKLRLNHPARKLPTVAPVRGLR